MWNAKLQKPPLALLEEMWASKIIMTVIVYNTWIKKKNPWVCSDTQQKREKVKGERKEEADFLQRKMSANKYRRNDRYWKSLFYNPQYHSAKITSVSSLSEKFLGNRMSNYPFTEYLLISKGEMYNRRIWQSQS